MRYKALVFTSSKRLGTESTSLEGVKGTSGISITRPLPWPLGHTISWCYKPTWMLFSALDAVVTSATAWVKIRVIFFRIPLFRELAHQFFRRPTAYATISNSLATCQRLQFSVHACMLMHVTACWGCTNTIRVLTHCRLWEKNPLLHWVVESASAVTQTWSSFYQPADLHSHPDTWSEM